MAFENLTNFITRQAEITKYNVKAHSPEILIGIGIVGVVTSTVLACRATVKANDILKERKENLEAFDKLAKDENVVDYSEEDLHNDIRTVNIQTGLKVVGLYLPAVTVGILGMSCFIKSNGIHREREASLAAAYASLDQLFKKYRQRAIAEYGEEIDKKLRTGSHQEKIETTYVDEDGKTKKRKETIDVVDGIDEEDFAEFFDDASPYWEKSGAYNDTFLARTQSTWNKVLYDRAKQNWERIGFVEWLEICRDLGISLSKEKIKKYKGWGWYVDLNDPNYQDVKIDFGFDERGFFRPRKPGQTDIPGMPIGYEKVYLLIPNIQCNIYSAIK